MSFKKGLTYKLKEKGFKIFQTVKEKAKEAINNQSEEVGEYTADRIIEASNDVVEELRKDSSKIIEDTANSLSEVETDTWLILREKIAPTGGFFNILFARILWVGAKVSSFVGALVLDNWTGNQEKEKNQGNLDKIFSWMLGSMFKKDNTLAIPA